MAPCELLEVAVRGTQGGAVIRLVVGLAYALVGAAIAGSHHFFDHITTVGQGLSAVLVIALWPLYLFGLHFQLGSGDWLVKI